MSLIHHPNLLRAYCSFTSGHHLWVVMPYMAGGSALHIMKTNFPEGFDEPIIATLLREVLRALVYLHYHGHIHRDVKVYIYLFVAWAFSLVPSERATCVKFVCCFVMVVHFCSVVLVP